MKTKICSDHLLFHTWICFSRRNFRSKYYYYSSCLFLSEITITGSKQRQTLPAEINPDSSTGFREGTNTKLLTSELVSKVLGVGVGDANQRSQNSIFGLASVLLKTADLTCPALIDRINLVFSTQASIFRVETL